MNKKELDNLKLEILKIEVKSLKVLSEKLDRNDYHKDIESVLRRANELKIEINELIQNEE
ncbi:hypothetical protein J2X31_002205 [Flavobacterium arsenatis]|uniref:Lacal_2735 family protein n=1 Tax=Flavobacterium arsenatis TaxID=1484332 RepID=A0ABU1TQF1_9FLAO|nr:hypothetical protein [Flavobacterium arsenatis]MDR6968190.1 hypothetical protein [Flavobacterium arsenatis]